MRKISLLFILGLVLVGLSSCGGKDEPDRRRELGNKSFTLVVKDVDYKLSFLANKSLIIEHQVSYDGDDFIKSLDEKTREAILKKKVERGSFTVKFNCLYNHDPFSSKVFIHKDVLSVEECAKKLAGIDNGIGDAITGILSIGIANIVANENKKDYAEELYKKLKEVTDFLGEECSFDYETQELKLKSGDKYKLK